LIDEHVEPLAVVECLDMAMLEESLRRRVIARGARNFRAYADLAEEYEPRRWASNGTDNAVLRMPAGPTVVITPWNAPFLLSTWKIAPALAAGNTVVFKPAEWSPLSCSYLMRPRRRSGHPDGVINVVQGFGDEVGAALVADPLVRRISFTGSPDDGHGDRTRGGRATWFPSPRSSVARARFVVYDDADVEARGPQRLLACTTTRARSASPARDCWSTSRSATALPRRLHRSDRRPRAR
jgi:5-carboxymethyl-2-hydroxymuconic-semialdehyde dehydrogenase